MDGILVKNDSGIVVLDSSGYNLHCISKTVLTRANFTAISGPNGASGLMATISTAGRTNPMIALATNGNGASGAACAIGGNIYASNWPSGSGPQVVAYLLDWSFPDESVSAGAKVWDANGKIIFSTKYAPVRIVGPLKAPGYIDDPTNPARTVTPPSGRTYAAVICSNLRSRYVGSYNTQTGDVIANDYYTGVSGGLSGNTVSMMDANSSPYDCFYGAIPLPHGSPGGNVGSSLGSLGAAAGCLVLDVTNL